MSKDLLAYKTIDPLGLINKNPTKKDPLGKRGPSRNVVLSQKYRFQFSHLF